MAEETSKLHANCAEFVTDDGRRFAWSDSNCRYEEVAPDGASFTLLRNRLTMIVEALKPREDVQLVSGAHPRIEIAFPTLDEAHAAAEIIDALPRKA